MAVFDALLGLGITCSQIITGYMIELTSFTYPFLMEASGTENEVVDWVIDSTNSFSFR